jgi:hypothetical protein
MEMIELLELVHRGEADTIFKTKTS